MTSIREGCHSREGETACQLEGLQLHTGGGQERFHGEGGILDRERAGRQEDT